MNIDGSNTLACITKATDNTVVFPLTQMPILRDLVVDMRWFFKQIESVQNSVPKRNKGMYHMKDLKERYLSTLQDLKAKGQETAAE
eukprot:NODE_7533_length_451_cov_64.972637_g2812_i1.p1 GENE.NODE_7533_length_451_cov_64.972637_g2812_i1~~NODE_7533_length_451_cov_64.972637_g2812_i1.p1  ORF type:complete len:101 (+),score=35.21 NODE_7533_length_451_cov_64.972637_g2812_i1:47-304(+)